MREIPNSGFYRTIVSLFTSFGYFENDHENERVLQSVHCALSGNGAFLLDTLNREHVLANLVPADEQELDDKQIRIRRTITDDGLRVEKETRISRPGCPLATYRESVRMYEKAEIENMLHRIGFVAPRFYGSLDGRAFSDESPRMVFVATKLDR